MAFHCSICGEESTGICVWCTKDTCQNHLCEKCARCSDCCECEVPLREPLRESAPVPPEPPPMAEPLEALEVVGDSAAAEPAIAQADGAEAPAVAPPADPMPEPPPERPME